MKSLPTNAPKAPTDFASVAWLPLASVDDSALVHALRQSHPHAASVLWQRYSRMVRGILLRSLGPDRDVEDLQQDVFLRFFEQLGNLRDPSSLKSYLFGITMNVIGSELRRRRVRRFLHLDSENDIPTSTAANQDNPSREALRRLYRILDNIDKRGRMAFVLRYFEKLELTELAQALGCSLATAKRSVSQASAKVALQMQRDPLLVSYLSADGQICGRG